MKILHTSDWHLGRSLYGRKRYEEYAGFLDWLGDTIQTQGIDALLIAGDVFDTSTPSNRAQKLYYRFLHRVSAGCCRHIVVIAGNHDSPSFLNAPRELLQALNVYVVGAMAEDPAEELIVLKDGQGRPQAIVCAVPYLRDRDIRTVEAGETLEDKNAKLVRGLKDHYADVCAVAEEKRSELENRGHPNIPVIAMGHLFTTGGRTVDGDGVRELYVGSLAHVGKEVFSSAIDYLALGHLHVPQRVGGTAHMRYCGAPIPMGYGEATQDKKVMVVRFNATLPVVHEIQVPCFQVLERIVGSLDDILARLEQLKQNKSRAWLEIEYTGREMVASLREIFEQALAGSAMEIRRIKNRPVLDRVIRSMQEDEVLDDLDPSDVFARCLDTFEVPDEDRETLTACYKEIIISLHEEDINAE